MRDWLARFRRLAGRDDRATAFREERAAISRATDLPAVDPRFRAEMEEWPRAPIDSIALGTSVAEPDLEVRLPITDIVGAGHGLVLGATGSGKSRLAAGIATQLLRRFARRPSSVGVWLVDHKGEMSSLLRELLADLLETLPRSEARRLADSFVVIDPFSESKLVPLGLLVPEPTVPLEVQAYEVTSLIDRLGGAQLGVQQDSFLFNCVLLAISRAIRLPDLLLLISDPRALVRAAMSSPLAEVRTYFASERHLSARSLEGVRARLHRLLRVPSLRCMLGARSSVSFRELLASKIVFIDTGSSVPLGCEDLSRFAAGFTTLRLARAIFERTPEEARRPVFIAVDEWQEGLAGGSEIAEHYERLLAMARSRGISLFLISQSLAGASRVSSTLPNVVRTNTSVQLLFRCAAEDAKQMAHMLPITGRRSRPPAPPWEEAPRSPYLSPPEERELLISEAPTLPDRTCYAWNRRRQYRAHLVHAMEVEPRPMLFRSARLAEILRHGTLAVPIAELERQGRAEETPLAPADALTEPMMAPWPSRRPRRPR